MQIEEMFQSVIAGVDIDHDYYCAERLVSNFDLARKISREWLGMVNSDPVELRVCDAIFTNAVPGTLIVSGADVEVDRISGQCKITITVCYNPRGYHYETISIGDTLTIKKHHVYESTSLAQFAPFHWKSSSPILEAAGNEQEA